MGDLMKKFLILCVFVVSSAINFAAWADDNLKAKQCHSEWKDDWLLEVYFDNAQHSFPTIDSDNCEDKVKAALEERMGNEAKGKYILIASTSKSGTNAYNQGLAKNRKNTVAELITKNFKEFKNSSDEDWVVGLTNAVVNKHGKNEWTDRMVMILVSPEGKGSSVDFETLARAYMKLHKFSDSLEVNVWRDEQGKFNTARLWSDSIAGVVLGTAGGLITSSVVKKNQIQEGFEDIQCVVGGQTVANWGDEFIVK